MFHLKINNDKAIDGVIPTLIKNNYNSSEFSFEVRARELLHGGAHQARLKSKGKIEISKPNYSLCSRAKNKAEVQVIPDRIKYKTNLSGETVVKVNSNINKW